MLNKKTFLLIVICCGVFQGVFSAPGIFDFLKGPIKHIRCVLHHIGNEFISHTHRHHNPCELHELHIIEDQDTIAMVPQRPRKVKGMISTGSGYDSVEIYTEKSVITSNDFGELMPRTSLNESAPAAKNTPTTTSKSEESNEVGKTWMFKEKCKQGEIATANGCKDLASIKTSTKPNQARK